MYTKQKIGWAIALVVVLIWSLFPVLSILMNSFKPASEFAG